MVGFRLGNPEWIEKLRGSSRLARRRRLKLGFFGPGAIGTGVILGGAAGHLILGAVIMAAGWFMLGLAFVMRPIPAVTWRARLAALLRGGPARRAAVNASGYASARARRSAVNRAAWSAQRARDGRAARSVGRLSPHEDEIAAWRERRKKKSFAEEHRRYSTG